MTQPKLPTPETYERELKFMPYRDSLKQVRDIVCRDAPRDAEVLDLMCGPGYLLGELAKRRGDLNLLGVDIDSRYIKHANRQYREIDCLGVRFEQGDVLEIPSQPDNKWDVVLCTGALHHIPFYKQEQVVEKIAGLTKPEGFAVISDAYIDYYKFETERRIAAARLGYEYLKATIKNGAPEDVVSATLDIMANDIHGKEFKTCLKYRWPILKKHFRQIKTMKTWPNKQIGGYGDYVHILRR